MLPLPALAHPFAAARTALAIVALLAVAGIAAAAADTPPAADPAADDAGRRTIVFKSLVGMMQYETKDRKSVV